VEATAPSEMPIKVSRFDELRVGIAAPEWACRPLGQSPATPAWRSAPRNASSDSPKCRAGEQVQDFGNPPAVLVAAEQWWLVICALAVSSEPFTPVPLPASVLLLGSGVLGLNALRRRPQA
jgi:PEP-CTERM motif